MLIILLPLLVMVIGCLMYAFAANPKVQELGRILFFVGAFFTVWGASGKVLAFGPVQVR